MTSKGPIKPITQPTYSQEYLRQLTSMNAFNLLPEKYFYIMGDKYDYYTGKKVRPRAT